MSKRKKVLILKTVRKEGKKNETQEGRETIKS